jgi:hypothetical protein
MTHDQAVAMFFPAGAALAMALTAWGIKKLFLDRRPSSVAQGGDGELRMSNRDADEIARHVEEAARSMRLALNNSTRTTAASPSQQVREPNRN